MNEHNENTGWYDVSDGREWYRQYSVSTASKPIPPAPQKKRAGIKITMLVLCVLILIAATALAFSPKSGEGDSVSVFSPSGGIPAQPAPDIGGTDGFDDFRDFFDSYYAPDSSITASSIERTQAAPGMAMQLNSSAGLEELSLTELYSRSIDSIVGISANVSTGSGYYWGTGIIMTEDGYILTNAHMISGTDSASVKTSDGVEYDALLVGEDTQSDLAILKINASGLKPVEFGISDELSIGDRVAAIGNPLGDELSGTMTDGIVSSINRGITVNGHVMNLIQTNAAINDGNSGGPLFNMYGQVVGITNMKMVAQYYEASIEGIGFAIPTSSAKNIVNQLFSAGTVSGRPGIGITVGSMPEGAAERYSLPSGLYISEVKASSDAYAKGIRAGDILTAVNGSEVLTTDDVNRIKDGLAVGDTITLTVFRDGSTSDIVVELMDMTALY